MVCEFHFDSNAPVTARLGVAYLLCCAEPQSFEAVLGGPSRRASLPFVPSSLSPSPRVPVHPFPAPRLRRVDARWQSRRVTAHAALLPPRLSVRRCSSLSADAASLARLSPRRRSSASVESSSCRSTSLSRCPSAAASASPPQRPQQSTDMELAHITETAGAAPSAASSAPAPSHPRPPASAPPRTLIHFKKNSKHAVSMALAQLGWREVRIKIPHSGAGKRGAKGKRGGTARMAELAVTEGSAAGSTALSGSLPASSPSPSPDAASSSDDADDDEAAAVDDPANADPSPASRAEPLEHARPKVKQPRTIISNLANYSAVQITPMAAALDDDPAAAGLSFSTPLSAPPSWDVAWVDMLADSEYSALGRLHRINQLPQMHKLSKKKFLAMQLNAMAKHEQTEYSFYPRSWVLPLQIEEVKAAFGAQAAGDATAPAIASSASSSSASSPSVSSPVLIVKPDFACEGRGIYLVDRFSSIDLDRGPLVVQEYIPRPLLLASGRKFDLRIYVLILSVAPLSLALFDDGLTRFCTESYTAPAPGSLGTAFQHLTNYAINKKHASFVLNTHESLPDEGSKWTIRTLFSKLAEEGRDMPTLWRDIADLVVKAVLASYGALSHAYRTAIPASTVDTDGGSAFQFLGFDVLLTEAPTAANRKAIRPFLIEINRNCSLKCDTPLDARIKVKAVAQALQLVDPRAPYRLQTKAQKDAEARSLRGMAGPAYREAQLALQQQSQWLRTTHCTLLFSALCSVLRLCSTHHCAHPPPLPCLLVPVDSCRSVRSSALRRRNDAWL